MNAIEGRSPLLELPAELRGLILRHLGWLHAIKLTRSSHSLCASYTNPRLKHVWKDLWCQIPDGLRLRRIKDAYSRCLYGYLRWVLISEQWDEYLLSHGDFRVLRTEYLYWNCKYPRKCRFLLPEECKNEWKARAKLTAMRTRARNRKREAEGVSEHIKKQLKLTLEGKRIKMF